MALKPRHRKFVSKYTEKGNGTEAAIYAGFSPKGAEVTASKLLRNPKVASAIDSRLATLDEKSELNAIRVRAEILKLLGFDPRKAFNADGTYKHIHEMPDDVSSAISGIEAGEDDGGIRRVKFVDRVRIVELAAKVLGMMKLEVTGKDGEPLIPPPPKIDFSAFSISELKNLAKKQPGNGAAH